MFTVQEIINMGADLYDNYNTPKAKIKSWLEIMHDNLSKEDFDIERVFDLICG